MIKQYFEYKTQQIETILNSSDASSDEKKLALDDNSRFLSYFKKDENGRVIVNKKMSREIIRLIKENKLPLVIDKHDLNVVIGNDMPNNDSDYKFENISDFVAIHKSFISPKNDSIITPENNGMTNTMAFEDPLTGIYHYVPYKIGNDTIHFTLNCVVQNHQVGNDWNNSKYAVMIDLDKLDKSKVLDVKSEDTFVDGNAELGDEYYVFCPIGESGDIVKENPGAMVIEYDGISLNEAITTMMIYSGKKVEPYGTYGWGKEKWNAESLIDDMDLNVISEREGYPVLTCEYGLALHSDTIYAARRMWKREYGAIITLIEYNKEKNIDMPDYAMEAVLQYGGAYAVPGRVPISVADYKDIVVPILEKHGYEVGENLFDGFDDSLKGTKDITRTEGVLSYVAMPDWEVELRNRVIESVKSQVFNDNISQGSRK